MPWKVNKTLIKSQRHKISGTEYLVGKARHTSTVEEACFCEISRTPFFSQDACYKDWIFNPRRKQCCLLASKIELVIRSKFDKSNSDKSFTGEDQQSTYLTGSL